MSHRFYNSDRNVNRWKICSDFSGRLDGTFADGTVRLLFCRSTNSISLCWTGVSKGLEVKFGVEIMVVDGSGDILLKESWGVTNLRCNSSVELNCIQPICQWNKWSYVEVKIGNLTRIANSGEPAWSYRTLRGEAELSPAKNVATDSQVANEEFMPTEQFSLSESNEVTNDSTSTSFSVDVSSATATIPSGDTTTTIETSANGKLQHNARVDLNQPKCHCRYPNCPIRLVDYKVQSGKESDPNAKPQQIEPTAVRTALKSPLSTAESVEQPQAKKQKKDPTSNVATVSTAHVAVVIPTLPSPNASVDSELPENPIEDVADVQNEQKGVVKEEITIDDSEDVDVPLPQANLPPRFPGWTVPDCNDFDMVSADGYTFRVGQAVLCLKSPFLNVFLRGNTTGRMTTMFNSDVVMELLQFIYEQNFIVAAGLYRAAHFYHMEELKQICQKKLGKRVSFANLHSTLTLAEEIPNSEELRGKCVQFMWKYRKSSQILLGLVDLNRQFPGLSEELSLYATTKYQK